MGGEGFSGSISSAAGFKADSLSSFNAFSRKMPLPVHGGFTPQPAQMPQKTVYVLALRNMVDQGFRSFLSVEKDSPEGQDARSPADQGAPQGTSRAHNSFLASTSHYMVPKFGRSAERLQGDQARPAESQKQEASHGSAGPEPSEPSAGRAPLERFRAGLSMDGSRLPSAMKQPDSLKMKLPDSGNSPRGADASPHSRAGAMKEMVSGTLRQAPGKVHDEPSMKQAVHEEVRKQLATGKPPADEKPSQAALKEHGTAWESAFKAMKKTTTSPERGEQAREHQSAAPEPRRESPPPLREKVVLPAFKEPHRDIPREEPPRAAAAEQEPPHTLLQRKDNPLARLRAEIKQKLESPPQQTVMPQQQSVREEMRNQVLKDSAVLREAQSQEPVRQTAAAVQHASTCIESILKKSRIETRKGDDVAAKLIALLMKSSSSFTYEHSSRVIDLSLALAEEMGIKDDQQLREIEDGALFHDIGETELDLKEAPPHVHARLSGYLGMADIKDCSFLHDIGKVRIPESILYKPSRLTDEEFEIIKQHPVIGEALLRPIESLRHVLPVVRHHHEKFDGSGYPDGLGGRDIPLAARIVSITDSFDAMVSDRPYRKGMPVEKAFAELQKGAGTQFDPGLVKAFLRIMRREF